MKFPILALLAIKSIIGAAAPFGASAAATTVAAPATATSPKIEAATMGKRDLMLNGRPAPVGRHRYAVRIISETPKNGEVYEGTCTGSLVAPDLVLTAAHCVDVGVGTTFMVYIGCESDDPDEGECPVYSIELSAASVHPCRKRECAYDRTQSDIALLKLQGPVAADGAGGIAPIRIVSPDQPLHGENVTLLGWGSDDNTGDTEHEVLHMLEKEYFDADSCNQITTDILDLDIYDFCTPLWNRLASGVGEGSFCTYRTGYSTCPGDSGGPLILEGASADEDVLVGVVSGVLVSAINGERGSCGEAEVGDGGGAVPGIHTSVAHHHEWIRTAICKLSESPPENLQCDDNEALMEDFLGEAACPTSVLHSKTIVDEQPFDGPMVLLGTDDAGYTCAIRPDCSDTIMYRPAVWVSSGTLQAGWTSLSFVSAVAIPFLMVAYM
jgi:hypothetical protein